MDPYKILGVEPQASWEEIRQAYRRAATKYHPDAGGDAWVFQQVQQAFDQLRAQYELGNTNSQPASGPSNTNSVYTTPPSGGRSASSFEHSRSTRTQSTSRDQSKGQGPASRPPKVSASLPWRKWLFGSPLILQSETGYFVLANFMDLVMTGILFRFGAIEANPIAATIYHFAGLGGLIALKLLTVLLVGGIAQWIAGRSLWKARALLIGGTAVVTLVVVHSLILARSQIG